MFSKLNRHRMSSSIVWIFSLYSVILISLIVMNFLLVSGLFANQRQKLIENEKAMVFELSEVLLSESALNKKFPDIWENIEGSIMILDRNQKPVYQTLSDYSSDDLIDILSDKSMYRNLFIDSRQINGYTIYYWTDTNAAVLDQRMVFVTSMVGLALIAIVLHVRKQIYLPLKRLENIIHGAVQGDIDYDFTQSAGSSSFKGIYSDIQQLFIKMKDLILRETNVHLMKKQAELDALQSQINPHFLYNTLDVIRGQASEHHIKEIELMALSLSKLFRYSISDHDAFVTLDEELENIDCYMTIQNVRFNNRLACHKVIDADTLKCKIPKLLIQPIVENAIYHGLEKKMGAGKLTINSYRTGSRLMISIQDDGLGISPERLAEINNALSNQNAGSRLINKNKKHFSIGLSNVNSRIKLLFGNEFGLFIYSTEGFGTTVQMILPVDDEN